MKKYIKEIIIVLFQLLVFYILPLFAGPTDMIGLVFLIIFATFVFSVMLGAISKEKIKYVYPVVIAILFIPSIFIYYNDSALIHSLWYLLISMVGMGIGVLIRLIIKSLIKNK